MNRMINQSNLIFKRCNDPTLEPAPIAQSVPPKNRICVGIATLCAYGFLAALALILPPQSPKRNEPTGLRDSLPSKKTLDVILREETNHTQGMERVHLGSNTPRGGGGSGTIDPALVDTVVPDIPVMIEPPEDLSKVVYPKFPVIAGDPTLPRAPGGNGLERGTGEGSKGLGRGTVEGATGRVHGGRKPFDHQLVPVHSPNLEYSLSPSEISKDGDRTIVRVTIEDDGRVSRAKAIKGPDFLFAKAEATALRWRFEPLPPHGLKGPMDVSITFVSRNRLK